MDPQPYFDKIQLIKILQELESTQKSITSASNQFIEQCKNNFQKEAVAQWFKVAKDNINLGEEQKMISLMFLCNDVNSKYNDDILMEEFKTTLEQIVKLLVDTPLNKVKNQCLKIFKIQSQRGVFPSEFLDSLSKLLKEGDQEKLPENLPHPPTELIKLVTNKNHYESFKEKSSNKENKTEGEIKKLQELKTKHCQHSLKSYKEVIQMIDKQHMRSIVEYKLLLQKIDKIESILKEREENPELIKHLPQTVYHDQQQQQ